MADDPQNQGEKPDNENEEPETGDTTPAADELGELPEGVKATMKKLRDEVKQAEKARKAAEAKAKELESASLSEKERAEQKAADAIARADAAEKRAREALLRATVLENAAEFRNPADALELGRSRIEFDDDGEPTNVKEALAELLSERPYLKRSAPDVGATNAETKRKGTIKQEDLKTMTPEQIVTARKAGQLDHLLGVS